jgi:hypothetical protein
MVIGGYTRKTDIRQNLNKLNKSNKIEEYIHECGITFSDYLSFGEISGSHGGGYEDGCLLGCCSV